MRIRVLHIITVMLLLSTTSLHSQNEGATPLAESAMNHLYQSPAQWSGAQYTTPPKSLNRLHLSYGVENYGAWSYDGGESDDIKGWMSRFGMGYTISPAHSVEVGVSWSDWDMKRMFSRVDASYLFNVTAFANRTEQPNKWELFMKLGVESYVDMPSEGVAFGASGAFRVKYNLSRSVGLYIEPKLAFVGGGGDFNSSLQNNLFMPSVAFGMTVNIGQVRDNIRSGIDYRRELWSDSEYECQQLFALKTNILFDAATVVNVGLEVPLCDYLSFNSQFTFPWWTASDKSRVLQMLSGTGELRYWLGDRSERAVMTGWFAGLYAGGGLYDLRNKSRGYQGEFYIASGVSGGYSHPINRRETIRMEYSLGIGYLRTNYRYYEGVFDNYYFVWRHDGDFSWFGPTNLSVSMSFMIGNMRRRR